ncbi:MAG: padX1 [Chloroflexi bacterium]|nr:padX1 [Chloroflexota bacterium]
MIQKRPYEFMTKYTQQTNWIDGRGNFIAFAFFLGGISGGLFLASAFIDGISSSQSLLGMFVAWLLSLGMGIAYMIHLTKPFRFWRMLSKPGTSWIARGFIFIMLFIGFTFLTLVLSMWAPNATGVITAFKILAGIFAFAQSIYTGFAVSYVSAIKIWNSAILPILFVVCGFSGGLAILMGIVVGGSESQIMSVENVTRVTLISFAVILIVYLWNSTYSSTAARDAVARMVGGSIASVFWVGVILLGVVIPIAISVATLFSHEPQVGLLIIATICEIIGGLTLRYVILKSGVYSPLVTSGGTEL